MKWTKATDRLPELDKRVALKFKGELTAGNFEEYNGDIACYMAHRGTYMRPSFIFIEWLDESLPASAVEEAEKLYPFKKVNHELFIGCNDLAKYQQLAHITCAGMYTGEIERLKDVLRRMWQTYVKSSMENQKCSQETIDVLYDEFKLKHNL